MLLWLPWVPWRTPAEESRPSRVHRLWRDPLAWQVTFFMGLQSALAYIVFGWLAPILRSRGLTAVDAGFALSLSVIAQAGASLVAPSLAMLGRDQRLANVVAVVVSLIGLFGCIYAPLSTVWVWSITLGIGQGATIAIALTLIALRATDPHIATRLSGMVQGIGYLIASCGPLLAGLLHSWTGGWNAVALLALVIGLGLAASGIGAGRAGHVGAGAEEARLGAKKQIHTEPRKHREGGFLTRTLSRKGALSRSLCASVSLWFNLLRGVFLQPLVHEQAQGIVRRVVAEMAAAGEAMVGEEAEGFGLVDAGLQADQMESMGAGGVFQMRQQLLAEAETAGARRDIDALDLGIGLAAFMPAFLGAAQHDGAAGEALAIDPADEEQHLRPRQGLDIEEMIALRGVEPLHIGVELGHQLAHLRPAWIGLLDDDEFLRRHDLPFWIDNSVAAFSPSKTASSAVRGAKASPMRWTGMPAAPSVAASASSGSPG